jgi:hypothetical protein
LNRTQARELGELLSITGSGKSESNVRTPKVRSYRGQSFGEFRRLSNRLTRRKRKFYTPEWRNAATNRFGEIRPAHGLIGQSGLQDVMRLLLHRAPLPGGPYAEPGFQRVIQTSYRNGRHNINVRIAGIEGSI